LDHFGGNKSRRKLEKARGGLAKWKPGQKLGMWGGKKTPTRRFYKTEGNQPKIPFSQKKITGHNRTRGLWVETKQLSWDRGRVRGPFRESGPRETFTRADKIEKKRGGVGKRTSCQNKLASKQKHKGGPTTKVTTQKKKKFVKLGGGGKKTHKKKSPKKKHGVWGRKKTTVQWVSGGAKAKKKRWNWAPNDGDALGG